MTLQEIQNKAQGIIHKWRDDDSAPYIELVDELAHMTVPEPSKDLEEAADDYTKGYYDDCSAAKRAAYHGFIAGYKYHADHTPLPEDTVLFNKGVAEGKRLMMDEWLKDRDGCFWDGVEEGKKAMREQMMKEAVEGLFQNTPFPTICLDDCKDYNFKPGDKVCVIVIPNTDEK